jgi:Aspartyl protease
MRSALLLALLLACASKAHGSCAAQSNEQFRISGEYQEGNLQGTFSRVVEPWSGRFNEAIDLGIVRRGSGFDGHHAWSRDVSGASHYLTSDFARRLAVSEAWLSSHLSCTAKGLTYRRFTPRGGAPVELWYDRSSGRLGRAALRYSENHLIHHYSDWRVIARGRSIPFTERDEDPDDESEAVYSVKRVARIRSASFVPPPIPNDSRILNGKSTTISFEDDNGHRVYLPVYLNGKGPFAFELDNGGHFILTAATAKELGLSGQGSFASTGAGNEIRQASFVKVAALGVGDALLENQTAKVLSLSHNDRPGRPPRAGILGLELFERFVVGIDHRQKTVSLRTFASSSTRSPGRPLRLIFDEDAPLVAGAIDGAKGNIMLDIGNAGSTIVEDHWAERHGLTAKLLGGTKVDAERLSTGAVTLGPFTLSDQKLAYFGRGERGSESTVSVAAIAGEPLLSQFNAVYDYEQETVWLEPLAAASPKSVENRP